MQPVIPHPKDGSESPRIQGLPDDLSGLDITSVTCDSRTVTQGSLFLAVKGYASDGHDYIAQAFEKGAAAVVAETLPRDLAPELEAKIILVTSSRKTTALAAARFYKFPSKDLTLVGVTGTNGKTTITWILENIFNACGFKTGVIGTVNIRFAGRTQDNPVTTPDAVSLPKNSLGDESGRYHPRGHGGLLPQPGPVQGGGVQVCRGHLHQPFPGPLRLPQGSG